MSSSQIPTSSTSSLSAVNQTQSQSQQKEQQQQQQQQTPSPSTTLSSLMPVNPSPFILRKQFNYRSKYNLVNLLRELENNLRDFTKSDINVCYFTFKRPTSSQHNMSTLTRSNTKTTTTATTSTEKASNNNSKENNNHDDDDEDDTIDDDEQLFLKESLRPTSFVHPPPYWMHSDLHFVDDFDYDVDFVNLKRTRFAKIHDAMSRSQNLIITMNAEYGTGMSLVGPPSAANNPASLSQSMTNPSSINNNNNNSSMTTSTYNRVPSFGSAKDKEYQHQQQQLQQTQNIIKIEYI